ncbi:MAG TPA: hypothetical protein VN634_05390 [Candidatus Limnocylindrales bacterium]|nr:hypothetical protein [Candidatus Limnocylindrales bacterium]
MTKGLRKLWNRRIAAFAVAALVLLPTALSGHRHESGDPAASAGCAVCVSTQHSPATVAAAPQLASILLPPTVIDVSVALAPAHVFQRPLSGRAPPLATTTPVA